MTALICCFALSSIKAQAIDTTTDNFLELKNELPIDLSVVAITPSVIHPEPGQKISIKVKVQNDGAVQLTNVGLDLYVGDNSSSTFSTIISSIDKKSTYLKSFTLIVPKDITFREYPIKAIIDPKNEIKETDESNNEKTYLLNIAIGENETKTSTPAPSVESTPSATPATSFMPIASASSTATSASVLPDLVVVVSDMQITPTSYKSGDSINLKTKVKNIGAVKASNIKVDLYFADTKICTKNINNLSKNGSNSLTCKYTIPANLVGSAVFKAVADPDNAITENNENNNSAEINASINEAKVDLAIKTSDLQITPNTYKGGDRVTLKAKITNSGNIKAKNIKVDFYFANAKIYTKTIASLSPKGASTVTYKYTLPINLQGTNIFKAVVDPDNAITESDESNNSAEINANINQAIVDLVVDSLKTSNVKPKVGQNVSIQVKIKNDGNVKVSNVKLNIYLGDNNDISAPNFTAIISNINKKAVSSKSFSWTIPNNIPGTNYPIRAVVDPDNSIAESNELNNNKTYLLNLTAPDLTIGLVNPSHSSIYFDSNESVSLWVRNDNVMPVSNVKVELYYYLLSDPTNLTKIAEGTIGALAKNQQSQIDLSGKPPALPIGSTIGFVVMLDPAGAIPEANEDNNTLNYTITVREKPHQMSCPCLFIGVSDEDGNPLNGATATLNNSESKTTVGMGGVVFENRPDTATYTLTIVYPNYRTITETINFNKNDENTTNLDYLLDKRAILNGTVKNSSGAPLQWVKVRIEGLGLESVTDAQGKYGFLLNGGTYTLRFVREGYNRIVESNYSVPPLSTKVLDKTMTPTTVAYVSLRVTDDEGNGLGNVNVFINNNLVGTTWEDGHFDFTTAAADNTKFTLKKPSYIDTEFTEETVKAGNEYRYDLIMYKPFTANHVERGATIVSWHQHEGTPANSFFIPEYNVDVWWGIGNIKMGLDYTKSGDQTKLTKLTVNVHGRQWECNRVEGDAEVETSAIDIPITIAAGSCTNKQTQMDVYKVAIESNGTEVWSDSSFWTSASDPNNTKTKVFTLSNLPVEWNNNLKVKVWLRVQKKAALGTGGDGSGALAGYLMDKKMITWFPQKPPVTKISTSWRQVGGYFVGILDNPVNAITGFTDMFTVEQFNQYAIEEVLPENFPGAPPSY